MMPTTQMTNSTHLARGPPGRVKIERRSIMAALCINARRRSGYRVAPCETWIAEAIADLLLA
jgi:hypothetical protein